MIQNRANLDSSSSNRFYITLTVILILLSLVGLYLFSLISKQSSDDDFIIDRSVNPDDTSTYLKPTVTTTLLEPSPVPGTKGGIADDVGNGLLSTDSFTLRYSPERKLHETREGGGTRYTLYSSSGNIAIHVGPTWSWSHPGRSFTTDFKVSDQPTFVYKITSQTIVDFQVDKTKYTIQCVHGGNSAQKSECDQLLSDFKLI